MFILNALCCISEPSGPPSTSKTNIVKKPISSVSNPDPHIPSPANSNLHFETTHQNSASASSDHTPTFQKLSNSNQSVKSNECNPGSDPCSLEEELQNKIVSLVSDNKNQQLQKSLKLTPTKPQTFYGWDWTDTEVKLWSIKDVLKFLEKVGLRKYHSTFYQNKIKGKDLVSLSEKELRDDLKMTQEDIRTMNVYIQLLKEKAQRETKQKNLSRSFGGHRKSLSLYKYHCNTYSCRKILNMVQNPIMEEESEEDLGEKYGRKQNMTTKDMYSSSNYSELLTN